MLSYEINPEQKAVVHPNYRLDQLTQQTGGTAVTLNAAGGNNSLFELPPVTYNLARSVLAFDMTIAAQVNDNVNAFRTLIPQIRQIQFYGRNSVMMCDLSDFDRYSKIVLASDNTLEDMLRNPGEYPLVRSNALPNANAARRPDTNNANLAYTEQLYVSNAGDATALTVRYRIPLSVFKNTILALDKDLYFGDITYFRIYWQEAGAVGFDSDDGAFAGAGALVGPITLSNLYFYQAVETNEAINTTLRASLEKGGLNYLIDYIHSNNFPLTTTAQSFYVKYGPGMGKRLKRIYWCQTSTAPATQNLRYETAIGDGVNVVSFYSMLDSQRIIQYNINCTDAGGNQDYMIMKEKMQGNTYQNSNIYKYNWFWCESFDGMKLIEHNDNIIAGIPIDNIERKYDVNLQTANAAFTYYVFGVVQRDLKITPLGIQLI